MRCPTSSLHRPSCTSWSQRLSRSVSGLTRLHRRGVITPPPPGPSLKSGYSVPNRHHLFGPIRPTLGHRDFTAWRRARCLRCAGALSTPEWFGLSLLTVLTYRPSLTPEVRSSFPSEHRCRHWPSPWSNGLGIPMFPQSVSCGAWFQGYWFATVTACRVAGPSTDLTGLPANGAFYFQLSAGRSPSPTAGYDYNSVWTPLLAGLSPAGMAANLAALDRPCSAQNRSENERGLKTPSLCRHPYVISEVLRTCPATARCIVPCAGCCGGRDRPATPAYRGPWTPKPPGVAEHVGMSRKPSLASTPARSTMRAKPAVEKGDSSPDVNTNCDFGSCSRCNLRRARIFIATTGWVAGVPLGDLFDHLVGAGEKRRRDFNTKRFRGLEIDGKQEFGGLLNRKLGRFGAFENSIDIVGAATRQGDVV